MASTRTEPVVANVLGDLAARLRAEGSVISPHVVEPTGTPELGILVASGPRTRAAPGDYALVIEAIREGYLLHYATPRILAGTDHDLALLAGDYLYAVGLERLAALGDLEAVRELADLISLLAQVHTEEGGSGAPELWLGAVVALAVGDSPGHAAAKEAVRTGDRDAPGLLAAEALAVAGRAGLGEALGVAAEAVGFRASERR